MDFQTQTNFESAQYNIDQARIDVNVLPKSREVSSVLTKLDEAEMWLLKAKRNA